MMESSAISASQQQLFKQASRFLASLDNDWQQHIARVGECQLELKPVQQPYEALIRAIAHQQLHGKAAQAILNRLLVLYEGKFPTALQLIQTDPQLIRACGFSARKLDSILGIAQAQLQGGIPDFSTAQKMQSEQLIAQLTQLKGVGRWTVEMLLIFNLGRLDVWPVDDYAVQQGYRRLKKLEQAPSKKELRTIGEQLAPYQSVAAWYLWRMMD